MFDNRNELNQHAEYSSPYLPSLDFRERRALEVAQDIAEAASRAQNISDYKSLYRMVASLDTLLTLRPANFQVNEEMSRGEQYITRLPQRINSFAVGFDSELFIAASGHRDGTLSIFTLVEGSLRCESSISFEKAPLHVSLSPDNTRLAVGFADGAVHIYALSRLNLDPSPLVRLPPTGLPNHGVKLIDNQTLLSTVGSGALMLLEIDYETQNLRPRGRYGATSPVIALDISNDGSKIYLIDSGTKRHTSGLKVLDTTAKRRVGYRVAKFTQIDRPTCLAMHPTLPQAVAGDAEGFLHLIEVSMEGHRSVRTSAPVRDVAYSPRGGLIATAQEGRLGGVELFALEEGSLRKVGAFHDKEGYSSVCFSPDGRLLLAGSREGMIRIFVSLE